MTSRFASTAPLLSKAERDLLSSLTGNEREVCEVLLCELDASLVVSGWERARQLAALSGGADESAGLRAGGANRDDSGGRPAAPPESADEQLQMEAA